MESKKDESGCSMFKEIQVENPQDMQLVLIQYSYKEMKMKEGVRSLTPRGCHVSSIISIAKKKNFTRARVTHSWAMQ